MKPSPYEDLLIFWIWRNIFILSFIPVGQFCFFLSTMIKEAASLCSVESAKPAEQSFRDLILVYGDHEIFKQFHSLGPAGGSQVTSARWCLNQLLIWRGMGMPVLWCWGLEIYFCSFLFLLSIQETLQSQWRPDFTRKVESEGTALILNAAPQEQRQASRGMFPEVNLLEGTCAH